MLYCISQLKIRAELTGKAEERELINFNYLSFGSLAGGATYGYLLASGINSDGQPIVASLGGSSGWAGLFKTIPLPSYLSSPSPPVYVEDKVDPEEDAEEKRSGCTIC